MQKKGQKERWSNEATKEKKSFKFVDDSQMKKIYSKPNCRQYNNFFNLN